MDGMSIVSHAESVEKKHEEVGAFIEMYAKGSNKTLVKEYGQTLVHNIEGMDLTVKGSMTDAAYGRQMAENISQMLEFGGEPLKRVIDVNLDIKRLYQLRYDEIAEINSRIADINESIYDCELYEEPNKEDYSLRASIEIETLKRESKIKEEKRDISPSREGETEGVKARGKKGADPKVEPRDDDLFGFNEACDEIKFRWNSQFIKDQDLWKKHSANLKKLKRDKIILTEKVDSELVTQQIMRGIQMALSSICNKIRNAVKERYKLKDLLQSRVRIEATGEIIANPYDKGNVAGMIAIIKSKFHKPTFVSFTNELVETMRLQINSNVMQNNPVQAVHAVDRIIGTWDTMNFWEYMTKDVFFTGILLRALPPENEITSRAIFEVASYVNQRDLNMKKGNTDYYECEGESMPVYQHLSQYLENVSKSLEMKRLKKTENGEDNNKNYQKSYKNASQTQNGNTETAASANATEIKSSDAKIEVKPSFDTQFKDSVTREMNVTTVAKNGFRYFYTSTKKDCELCKDSSTAHKPKCYLGQCKKCNNYGHKADNCRQLPGSFAKEKHQANLADDLGTRCDQEA